MEADDSQLDRLNHEFALELKSTENLKRDAAELQKHLPS